MHDLAWVVHMYVGGGGGGSSKPLLGLFRFVLLSFAIARSQDVAVSRLSARRLRARIPSSRLKWGKRERHFLNQKIVREKSETRPLFFIHFLRLN